MNKNSVEKIAIEAIYTNGFAYTCDGYRTHIYGLRELNNYRSYDSWIRSKVSELMGIDHIYYELFQILDKDAKDFAEILFRLTRHPNKDRHELIKRFIYLRSYGSTSLELPNIEKLGPSRTQNWWEEYSNENT